MNTLFWKTHRVGSVRRKIREWATIRRGWLPGRKGKRRRQTPLGGDSCRDWLDREPSFDKNAHYKGHLARRNDKKRKKRPGSGREFDELRWGGGKTNASPSFTAK